VWEIYGDEGSRRILVEVSRTAMAVANEFLPEETVAAKETQGRSEIEKILNDTEPPRRISLGTTGYLGPTPLRPDLLLTADDGRVVAVVDVKNPQVLTLPEASVQRDRYLSGIAARFFLIVSQNQGFLFDQQRAEYQPAAQLEMFEVVSRYYPSASPGQRFKGLELELIVQQWLRDLTHGQLVAQSPADRALADTGFTEAVRGARIDVSPTV
jgi:hypothetical protein